MIIAIGALVRTLLRAFDVSLPYTVILMVLGLLIGFVSQSTTACTDWSMYTKIARTPPKLILFVFLPVLIYESAFAMKAHVFYRSAIQIMILAFPGILICTFITAFVCMQFFYAYKWDFVTASLYGSIISATDPVAVVAILKEIGNLNRLLINVNYFS
jgi:sodium/hydrogen exchanger 10/11